MYLVCRIEEIIAKDSWHSRRSNKAHGGSGRYFKNSRSTQENESPPYRDDRSSPSGQSDQASDSTFKSRHPSGRMWSGSAASRATSKAHQSILVQENGARKVRSRLPASIFHETRGMRMKFSSFSRQPVHPRKRTPFRRGPAPWAKNSFAAGSTCSSRTLSCCSTRSWTRWRRRPCIAVNRDPRRSWAATCPSYQRDSAAPGPSTLPYHDHRSPVSAVDADCWTAGRMQLTSAACRDWCRTIWSMTLLWSRREAPWTRWNRTRRGCSSTGEWQLPNCRRKYVTKIEWNFSKESTDSEESQLRPSWGILRISLLL